MEEKNEEVTTNETSTQSETRFTIESWTMIIGVLTMVVGVIAGLVVGQNLGYYGDMNWGVCLGISASSIVFGTLFLALAQIIHLLDEIKNK